MISVRHLLLEECASEYRPRSLKPEHNAENCVSVNLSRFAKKEKAKRRGGGATSICSPMSPSSRTAEYLSRGRDLPSREDLSELPDRRDGPRLADCLVRGNEGQVIDQRGGTDNAVGRIFGIAGWQSVSLEGNIGGDWKNGEATLNFGKNRRRVRPQINLSATCKSGDFD